MQENDIKNLSTSNDEILRRWLASIPMGIYRSTIDRILEKCLISKSTFANWRYGNCRIPLSGQRDINEVAREISGRDIFTIAYPGDNPNNA